jgi:hypothetical protein
LVLVELLEDLLDSSPGIKLCLLVLMLKWILRETVFVEACLCLWTLYWCLRRWFCVKRTTVTVKHKRSDRLGLWFQLFFLINTFDVYSGRGWLDFWYFAADNRFLNPLAIRALYAAIFKAAVVSYGRLLCVYVLRLLILNIFN